MKTINEVIKKYEICSSQITCSTCPYFQEICFCDPDVLWYLREYKKYTDTMCALSDYYEWVHSADNPPLTWDELQKMKGKPIWVEDHNDDDEPDKRWYIVERFVKEQGDEYAVLNDYYFSRKYFNDKTDGWQAYRKERA